MSLEIINLTASVDNKIILENINLKIGRGELHVLMGPNGSGKSTLAGVLMGNPRYAFNRRNYMLILDGKNITQKEPFEKSKSGLFLAFQNPISIPGVSVASMLRIACLEKTDTKKGKSVRSHNPALSVIDLNKKLVEEANRLSINKELLGRGLNEEFSGGEKKKIEMLQALIIAPKYALFDEIDTGLDVDALKIVALSIARLIENKSGVLLITHYQRILKYLKPDFVHILVRGKIVKSGKKNLINLIEKEGFKQFS